MNKDKRYIEEYELIARAFMLVGILVLNIEIMKNTDIFLNVTYVLTSLILSFFQGLFKTRKKKILKYLNMANSIIFSIMGFKVALVFLTLLIIEELIKSRYGTIIGFAIISIIAILNSQESYAFMYFYIETIFLVGLKTIYAYKEKLRKLNKENDDLRKKYYENIKSYDKYKDTNEQNIRLIKLEERNEIGRSMHDKIGHVIAGSLMRLEAAKLVLENNEEMGIKMIDEVILNLRTGMDDIRGIIHKITPKADEIGINKIKTMLSNKLKETGIEHKIIADGDLTKLNYKIWSIIENTVLELSTNAIKYSNCSNIKLNINVLNKIVRIDFKDDGDGSKNYIKGFGLSKIEEDLINNNGTLRINREDGFQVIATIKI